MMGSLAVADRERRCLHCVVLAHVLVGVLGFLVFVVHGHGRCCVV